MKILNIVSTPFELYYLSSVASLLLERDKNLKIELLIRKELKDKITPEIRRLYSEIKLAEFPTLSFPLDKNPIKTIFNFFDNLYHTLKFRNYLKKINFDIDVICISSFREFFANVLCREVSKNTRLVALRMATQKLEELGNFKKRPLLSFLLNIKNFFFGYSLMDYKFWVASEGKIEKNFIKYPYHRTISITDYNIKRESDSWRLPAPFIALRKIYGPISEKKTPVILVAGERTPLFAGWNENSQKKYDEFFDYLRENFKNYKLYFKPRKTLTDFSKFNLKGFQILSADIPLEEVCLKENISKVISVKSTSSKVGAYFGIPAYLLYPMFNLPKNLKFLANSYFEDVQSIIKVNKFEDLKKRPTDNIYQKYSVDNLASLYLEVIMNK